ncbi:sulfatase/phosphatase domain-containing protein [Rhodopirellula sp. JC639]|uniref:sulfatase/phosphatase domain-containing protein n=1 Tax=Stieleria mannarensis TaxID=2755585 RepID=UPI003369CE0F
MDDNTVIIFTSDHGLYSGQQGLAGKAFCYEQTTHVPLIIYNPMVPDAARGKRSDQLVQSIDIAPTMLDFAGIDTPESFQGKSLRNLIQGSDQPVHEYIFTESLWSTHFGNPRIEAVQDKRWKYIRYYKNENFPAAWKIRVAKELGIPQNKMLYGVHDDAIAVYRYYVEAPQACSATPPTASRVIKPSESQCHRQLVPKAIRPVSRRR